jgi:hypothetical protein
MRDTKPSNKIDVNEIVDLWKNALRDDKFRTLDDSYKFSIKAARAMLFAKHEASLRNTDSVTHHITLEDIVAGIAREGK